MSRVAVIGEEAAVGAFALAGALVLTASDAAGLRSAWENLPPDTAAVVLTATAAAAIGVARFADGCPPSVVMPSVVMPS